MLSTNKHRSLRLDEVVMIPQGSCNSAIKATLVWIKAFVLVHGCVCCVCERELKSRSFQQRPGLSIIQTLI